MNFWHYNHFFRVVYYEKEKILMKNFDYKIYGMLISMTEDYISYISKNIFVQLYHGSIYILPFTYLFSWHMCPVITRSESLQIDNILYNLNRLI